MKAKIEIEMDNAAFSDDPHSELARILRAASEQLDRGNAIGGHLNLRDANGNTVGALRISPPRSP